MSAVSHRTDQPLNIISPACSHPILVSPDCFWSARSSEVDPPIAVLSSDYLSGSVLATLIALGKIAGIQNYRAVVFHGPYFQHHGQRCFVEIKIHLVPAIDDDVSLVADPFEILCIQ